MKEYALNDKVEAIQEIIQENKKQSRTILIVYFIFFASFIVALVPLSIASIFALMICVCTLAVIYSIRSRAEEDSITENQMTFLIRTFWRTNLYLVITCALGGGYLVTFADYLPLKPCTDYFERYFLSIANNMSLEKLVIIFSKCEGDFTQSNWKHLMISMTIVICPALSYMIYRITKGTHAVFNNSLIPQHKL